MWKSTKTVALEQHMDAITVAVAAPGRQPPEFCGDVPSTPEAVRKLVGRLDDGKMDLRFCYEAGPCGYGLYRQLTMMDYDCSVVAPSLSPRRPGERIKTDRRDALTLARQHRSGDLVAGWVPRMKTQQIVFQEYVDGVRHAGRLVEALEADMVQALETWSLAPVVRSLRALRGGNLIVAMTVMSELGDVTRFDSPTQLMAYVGQVPSEHSTGRSRRPSRLL